MKQRADTPKVSFRGNPNLDRQSVRLAKRLNTCYIATEVRVLGPFHESNVRGELNLLCNMKLVELNHVAHSATT